ncbi:DNA/RNA non-specific endonuclease [Metasolibacillus sp. FSL H7-0170]|uniref:DNA/RNA non-specific endonuclease n=1 Tax=Metasolibacillus sp. FSL H7-0170 TaxID=2921431 RepID=UPI003159352F
MGKFWKSIGKAIASIPVVGNAIKSAKKTAQKVKTEVKKVAEKVEAKLTELKESVEELLEELEESVEEALGKVTTYARKLQNNLDELALVQWVKNDAKSFVLAAYKKTKKWVKGGWREGLSIGVDFIPIVGNLKAGIEAVIGIDPITGRKLSTAERAIAGAAIIGGPLVKGAKHVGKGAMKIIPNSNKLVNSLSEPLAKLKEGGQKIAEKAAAKATELKAQANTMMVQAKQGMRESMDNAGRALRGNEPTLATVGGSSSHNSVWRMEDRRSSTSPSSGKKEKEPQSSKKPTPVEYGEHFTKDGRKKVLKPNVEYKSPDGYTYRTDYNGRIVECEGTLVLGKADRSPYAQRTVGGKDRLPDDDGGHLIGAQFKGPKDIDNLVPQNSQINRSGGEWFDMETEWANALKETPPKKVTVQINPTYSGDSMRPDSFLVEYVIEGEFPVIREIANKKGG